MRRSCLWHPSVVETLREDTLWFQCACSKFIFMKWTRKGKVISVCSPTSISPLSFKVGMGYVHPRAFEKVSVPTFARNQSDSRLCSDGWWLTVQVSRVPRYPEVRGALWKQVPRFRELDKFTNYLWEPSMFLSLNKCVVLSESRR